MTYALEMDDAVRALWTQALRSGDYTQGKGRLVIPAGQEVDNGDVADVDRYCCLGVLCDLAVKAGVAERIDIESAGYAKVVRFGTGGNDDTELPEVVARWAGLVDEPDDGIYISDPYLTGRHEGKYAILPASTWNDSYGATFTDIADMIDAQI